MITLTKEKDLLILKKDNKELIYSLKEHNFISDTKGFNRVKYTDITYSKDTEIYEEILRILAIASSEGYVRCMKLLSQHPWVEILIKSGIVFSAISWCCKYKYLYNELIINGKGKNPSEILGISTYRISKLKNRQELSNDHILFLRNLDKKFHINLLDSFNFKDENMRMTDIFGDIRVYHLTSKRVKNNLFYTGGFYSIVTDLLSWGYSLKELSSYANDYKSNHLLSPEEVLLLLYSYVDWNRFLGRKGFTKYPKDLLSMANKVSIESEDTHTYLSARYRELYTEKYNTENISMPTTYEEFIHKAKSMENCLLKESQPYLWNIINKETVILFSEYKGYKACIELKIKEDTIIEIGQIHGVRNKSIPTKEELKEELLLKLKKLNINTI